MYSFKASHTQIKGSGGSSEADSYLPNTIEWNICEEEVPDKDDPTTTQLIYILIILKGSFAQTRHSSVFTETRSVVAQFQGIPGIAVFELLDCCLKARVYIILEIRRDWRYQTK